MLGLQTAVEETEVESSEHHESYLGIGKDYIQSRARDSNEKDEGSPEGCIEGGRKRGLRGGRVG